MKVIRKSLLIAAAGIITVGASQMLAADAAKGADLYGKKCKTCHGADGAGTPAMLKKFADKMKPLGSPAIQGMKDPELSKAIATAANHKAIAKTLQPADIDNLVAHVRTLKK